MNNLPMKLHRLTLKFSGESSHLEEPFLDHYYKASLIQIRIFVFLGALAYSAFGIMDVLLIPEQTFNALFIGFIIIGPVVVFSGFFLLSFSGFFKKYIQPIMAFVYILAGSGAISMIVTARSPVSYFYYAGLMLVFMWCYTLLRLFFVWASIAGWLLIILYEIGAIWIILLP